MPYRRSTRANLGHGGAIRQLEMAVNHIRPDLQEPSKRKRKSAVDAMPEDLPENVMAPQLPAKRQKSSQVPVYISIQCIDSF